MIPCPLVPYAYQGREIDGARRYTMPTGQPVTLRWPAGAAVFVARDLRAFIEPAETAAMLGRQIEQVDEDGARRLYYRCTAQVWEWLRDHHPAVTLALVRGLLVQVYGEAGVARVEAAALPPAPSPGGVPSRVLPGRPGTRAAKQLAPIFSGGSQRVEVLR